MVYSNTIQSLVAILRAMPNLGIAFADEDREVIENKAPVDCRLFTERVTHISRFLYLSRLENCMQIRITFW